MHVCAAFAGPRVHTVPAGGSAVCLFWGHSFIFTRLRGPLTKPWILWSGPHTSPGTVLEMRGGLLVGTEDRHSEGEGQRWSLNPTLKLPHPQFPCLPSIGNDSIFSPRGL